MGHPLCRIRPGWKQFCHLNHWSSRCHIGLLYTAAAAAGSLRNQRIQAAQALRPLPCLRLGLRQFLDLWRGLGQCRQAAATQRLDTFPALSGGWWRGRRTKPHCWWGGGRPGHGWHWGESLPGTERGWGGSLEGWGACAGRICWTEGSLGGWWSGDCRHCFAEKRWWERGNCRHRLQQQGGESWLVRLLTLLPQNRLLLPSPLQPEAVHLRAGKGLPGRPHKSIPSARVIWQRLHYHSLRGGGGRFSSPSLPARQKKPQRRWCSRGRLSGTSRLLKSNFCLLHLNFASALLWLCQDSQALALPQGSPSPSVKVCYSCVPEEDREWNIFYFMQKGRMTLKCYLLAGCRYERLHRRTGLRWTDQWIGLGHGYTLVRRRSRDEWKYMMRWYRMELTGMEIYSDRLPRLPERRVQHASYATPPSQTSRRSLRSSSSLSPLVIFIATTNTNTIRPSEKSKTPTKMRFCTCALIVQPKILSLFFLIIFCKFCFSFI